MRVLWLTNMVLPCYSSTMGEESKVVGGWLTGMHTQLLANPNMQIITVYPSLRHRDIYKGNDFCYAIPVQNMFSSRVDAKTIKNCSELLAMIKPDIVHIWGTEWPHSLAMVEACIAQKYIARTVVNLQGNNGSIAYHMRSGVPTKDFLRSTFHDFVRHNSLLQEQKRLFKIQNIEKALLENIQYVIGRTEWDKAWSQFYNNEIKYYHCNEIIRGSFYDNAGKWRLDDCETNSILCGLQYSPVKGLHYLLQSLKMVQQRYPTTKLYILGEDITRKGQRVNGALRITTYGKYIKKLIKDLDLKDSVVFLGMLGEEELIEVLLKRHLFVSCSSIENESNLLSEARMLGVPTVVSYVGGVTSRVHNGIDCYCYQHDDIMMLQHYICKVFSDNKVACSISENALKMQRMLNDKERNSQVQVEIYNSIIKSSIEEDC